MKKLGLIAVVAIVSVAIDGLGDGGRAEAGAPSGNARSVEDVLVRIALRGLAYDHYKVRWSALGVLQQLDVTPPAARPLLIAILTNNEENSALRTRAARSLLKLGRGVVPDILELHDAEDGGSLRHVFLAFDRPSRGAKDVLLALLLSRDASLRAKAYAVIGTLAGEALPFLARALDGDDRAAQGVAIRSFRDVDLGPEALPVVVAALSHANVHVRREAAALISRIEPKTDEVVRALVELAKDADPRVRITAIRTCLQAGIGPAAHVGAVADVLLPREHGAASPSLANRIDAAKLLGEIGPPARDALPVLLGILHRKPTHSDTRLKGAVLAALPKLGPETMDHVLPFLGDTNAELRRAAAAALAAYGPEAEVPATPLSALLKDKDITTRRHAACALAKARAIPSDTITVLSKAMKAERDHETLELLGSALLRMGRPGRAALLEVLRCRNHLARWKASRALGKLGIDVFDDLAAMLEPTRGVAKGHVGPKHYYLNVAGAMSMMGARVVPRVKGWLETGDRYKKEVAVGVLSTISPEGIDLLRPMIDAEQSSATYYLLKNNLWRPGLEWPRMVALYLGLAADPSRKVRLLAAARLSALTWKEGGTDAVPALVGLLRDRDPKVREHIVNALGKIRERRDVSSPALIRRTRDLVPAVRVAACKALRYESDAGACSAMVSALFRERDAKLRLEIARWCFARKYRAIPRLLEVIRGPDAKRRALAAVALRSVGPLAVVVLMDLFESKDPELREIAVDGLKAMGDLAAPALIEMINRP